MAKKQSFDVQTVLKHHYWIVAGLAGLALPVFWYVAVGGLAEDFSKGKTARDTVRQQVDGFQTGGQPNPEINAELEKREARLKEEVYKAWKFQWERQQPPMDWDLTNMWDKPLLKTLVELKQVQAPQIFEDARRKGTEIPVHLRSAYGAWLKKDVGGLPEEDAGDAVQFRHVYPLIGLRRPIVPKDDEPEKARGKEKGKGEAGQFGGAVGGAGNKAGGGGRGDNRPVVQHEGKVYWPESERSFLESKFGNGPAWRREPSTAQVIYTHESMNVYAMLLYYVVAQTNGDQTEHQLLAIKKIVTIRQGEDCQRPAKASSQSTNGAGNGPPGVGGPAINPGGPASENRQGATADPWAAFAVGSLGGAGGGRGAGGGIEMGGGGGGEKSENGPTPPDGRYRYVDDEGFAVADPKVQPYAEFRMLPVIMRFVMDQRRLPEVLANCVQSPLPIEVKQLNMRDPRGETKRGGAAAGAGAARFGEGAVVKKAAFEGAGNNGGARPGAEGAETFGGEIELGPYDQEVEIKGIIYIYNPPDPTKVGKGAEAPADNKAPGEKAPEGQGNKAPPEKSPAAKSEAGKSSGGETPGPEKVGAGKTATEKTTTEKTGAEKTGTEKTGDAPKAPPAKTPAGGAKAVAG